MDKRKRVHPLLFAPCTCRLSPRLLCLACARWMRHFNAVIQRRNALEAAK